MRFAVGDGRGAFACAFRVAQHFGGVPQLLERGQVLRGRLFRQAGLLLPGHVGQRFGQFAEGFDLAGGAFAVEQRGAGVGGVRGEQQARAGAYAAAVVGGQRRAVS
ncbi:hypothetical protein GO283_04719 [Ralstonia solanacearum]|nr:hypothetical protein [Ralstonia solanacearum]NKA90873.1 hypothetical protein [Ralstonia solanacearum]NKA96156.1 hypothetical protein [Ralstonia solanacearum]NKB15196.1 hypothetical protein [Ralstonia solanacearum]